MDFNDALVHGGTGFCTERFIQILFDILHIPKTYLQLSNMILEL